jgi:hypothetical protein
MIRSSITVALRSHRPRCVGPTRATTIPLVEIFHSDIVVWLQASDERRSSVRGPMATVLKDPCAGETQLSPIAHEKIYEFSCS